MKCLMNLGFSHDFIMKIMTCVLTVKHRIQANGQLLDSFIPYGGLRQGVSSQPTYIFSVAKLYPKLTSLLENTIKFHSQKSLLKRTYFNSLVGG